MRGAIAAAIFCVSAAPVVAETWHDLTPGEAWVFAGDWVGMCQVDQPFQCHAQTTVGAQGDAGPGQVTLWWEPWGDEGYSLTFFATDAPKKIGGPVRMSIDGGEMTLAEDEDYFANWGEYDDPSHMISIGEPLVVDTLVEDMKSGQSLVWDWGEGQLVVPLAGFARTFETVATYREEITQ